MISFEGGLPSVIIILISALIVVESGSILHQTHTFSCEELVKSQQDIGPYEDIEFLTEEEYREEMRESRNRTVKIPEFNSSQDLGDIPR